VHLQLSPVNLAPIFFFTLRHARAPSAPPGYAYGWKKTVLTCTAISSIGDRITRILKSCLRLHFLSHYSTCQVSDLTRTTGHKQNTDPTRPDQSMENLFCRYCSKLWSFVPLCSELIFFNFSMILLSYSVYSVSSIIWWIKIINPWRRRDPKVEFPKYKALTSPMLFNLYFKNVKSCKHDMHEKYA